MFKHIVFALVLCTLASTSFALDELPKEMEGTWSATSFSGGDIRTGKVSVRIDDQNGGALKGVMNWEGGRECELRNEPTTGSWDGTTLVLRTTFTSSITFAGCTGPAEFVIKRMANGRFEGDTKRFTNYSLTVSLSPKTR